MPAGIIAPFNGVVIISLEWQRSTDFVRSEPFLYLHEGLLPHGDEYFVNLNTSESIFHTLVHLMGRCYNPVCHFSV